MQLPTRASGTLRADSRACRAALLMEPDSIMGKDGAPSLLLLQSPGHIWYQGVQEEMCWGLGAADQGDMRHEVVFSPQC